MRVEIDCSAITPPGVYVSRASLPNRFKPNDPWNPEWNGEEIESDDGLGFFRGLVLGLAVNAFLLTGIYLAWRVL